MKILYDIECFPGFFMLGVKNYVSKELFYYEMSERKDDRIALYNYLVNYKGFAVSFNGIYYDKVVLCYIVKEWNRLKDMSVQDFCQTVKDFSDLVIKDDHESTKYYKWGWNKEWIEVDLFCYWSKMLRQSKKISLKSLGVQLNFDEIQELPYRHDSVLTKEQMEDIVTYNQRNDLGILELLVKRVEPQILLRKGIKDQYGLECYSMDAPKIAQKLIEKFLVEKTENEEFCFTGKGRDKAPRQTWRTSINIKDILIPIDFSGEYIAPRPTKIESKQTFLYENAVSFYTDLKNVSVTDTNSISASVKFGSLICDFGSGGLHSRNKPIIYRSDEKYTIVDFDYGSFYPNLISNYKFVPHHLGESFLELYQELITKRIAAKKAGNKLEAEVGKLILNSTYGMLNNDYSFMKDVQQTLSVCLNGQFILAYMLERMLDKQYVPIYVNTDGFSVLCKTDEVSDCIQYGIEQNIFGIELETDIFKDWYIIDVNNYLAVKTNGQLKKKGLFVTEPDLGNSVDELVIPKCLELYFVKGIKPEEVLRDPVKYGLTIYDFCLSKKVDKSYTIYWNGKVQQQLNRFYVSKKGAFLYKKKNTKNTMENVLKGFGVQLFNKYENKPFEQYEIHTEYYLSKINEVIHELQPNQLSLF